MWKWLDKGESARLTLCRDGWWAVEIWEKYLTAAALGVDDE